MEPTFWKYLDVFSAIFCLIYALQTLIVHKKRHAHHRYFFLFLLNLGVLLVFLSLVAFKVKVAVLAVLPIFEFAFLNLAPSMYLNIKSLVSPQEKSTHFKHYILPLTFLFLIGVFSLLAITQTGELQVLSVNWVRYLFFTSTFAFVFQNGWYIFLIFRRLRLHKKNLESYFSFTEKIDLSWLKIHTLGYVLFILGMIVINLLPGPSELSSDIHRVFLFLYVNFIGINALRQSPVYAQEEEKEALEIESKELSEKQLATIDQLQERFEVLIHEQQLFLDQDLTIFKLAKIMGSNTNYLSILINSRYEMSFANFINLQRIEYAKKALQSGANQQLTIESIGNSSGFKSKSSFNAAFKKVEGITPSEYIKISAN